MIFGYGPNSFLLDLHSFLVFLVLTVLMAVFGGILISKQADKKTVGWLKILSVVAVFLVVLLIVTGIVPDMAYTSGANLTYTSTSQYSNITQNVTDAQLGNFTAPLVFDFMEHVTLLGAGLAGVVAMLIWALGPLVITNSTVKKGVLLLLAVGWIWLIILGALGIILTKTMTLPPFI